jgi:tetratricopeptide (TPR) repeat protein
VRIRAILNAVTDDPFAREWWAAVERRDAAALKQLVSRPEVRRMSSRELASLADGLGPFSGTIEALGPLLEIAYEKFPGEFWVHFRLAFQADFAGKDADEREKQEQVRRHLTAALAIRPNSAVARAAVGMEILERKKDDPAGLRMLRSAAEADPTSPWPHLLVATLAVEQDEWPEAFRAFKEAVRLDPDTSYFMIQATVFLFPTFPAEGVKRPPAADLLRFIEELIRIQSRHPGGYYLLGSYHYQSGDHRAALAAFREGNRCGAPDYPARAAVAFQVEELEAEARVEEELLPGALSGEAPPGDGPTVVRLAGYCATFEKKYALATRFAAEGLESFPNLRDDWMNVGRFAGWAVQAGLGNGADADATPLIVRERCRRLALEWMRETVRREGENAGAMAFHLNGIRDFDPVRDPTELAKLPPGERAGWEQVWAAVNPAVAPPPRPKQ